MVESRRSMPIRGEPGSESARNVETPLGKHNRRWYAPRLITPSKWVFRRNNNEFPEIDKKSWRLAIGGNVENPVELTYKDLQKMPAENLIVTMECAGNGRSQFQPSASGEQWSIGAVSTVRYKGVRLKDALALAKLGEDVQYLVFASGDGKEEGGKPFVRRLRIDEITDDVLLAYAMNGRKLPREHGGPVRLVVPGWYGMASVKWVTGISAENEKPELHFMDNRYIKENKHGKKTPVTIMQPRSLIVTPSEGSAVKKGRRKIRGVAWSSPQKPVDKVEVSTDGGKSWQDAKFIDKRRHNKYAWRRWKMTWKAQPGEAQLVSRAITSSGEVQPAQAEWNALGYENNSWKAQQVPIRVF